MKRIKIIITVFLVCLAARGENTLRNDGDSIRLSLLTCAPGNEIYSYFGHTAIRYEEPSKGMDVVFNYGLFNFGAPNFILRFALGQTDYVLGVIPYDRFVAEYAFDERSVWQQRLNLTPDESQKLASLLIENSKPENRVYRYNFFYDNCSTRPRDKIEESVQGNIVYDYPVKDGTKSFRDLVHQYTKGHPWSQFGIDLCIGSEADRPITSRQMMFIPFYLEDALATARIVNTGTDRPLVAERRLIVDCENASAASETTGIWDIFTPIRSALLLFIIVTIATIYGIRKKRSLWGIDLVLFGMAGIAGCILAFLALFSEHPTVSSNYLLFVFHPGQLFFLPIIINAARKGRKCWYHMLNLAVLTLFILLFPLIPQRIDLAVVPLALSLLIRSASNLILTYKKQK
ncbi:lipoprotein N-acyltransferase Lnb [Bacteroides sp.]